MRTESSDDTVFHLSISLCTFHPLILWWDISGQNTLVHNILTNNKNQHKENKDFQHTKKNQIIPQTISDKTFPQSLREPLVFPLICHGSVYLWQVSFLCLSVQAVLACINVTSLRQMLLQFQDLPDLWRISKIDFVRVAAPWDIPSSKWYIWNIRACVWMCVQVVWLVTWLSVVILNVDMGLAIGVVFSMMTVICRTQRWLKSVMFPAILKTFFYFFVNYQRAISFGHNEVAFGKKSCVLLFFMKYK